MARVELVLGIVVLLLWVYALVSLVLTPEHEVRGVPKWAWLVLIVLLPLLGAVLWIGVGRSRGAGIPRLRSAAPPPVGPRTYQAMTADERIRRLEEDLARLEQEGREGEARA
ncbi:PLDc N-terminal domain-containing protein [Amnibacterium endophyticum]|uniref:PLDc N-terminal domain-containing protein n=1 Tax=Amnibacterium endophyticum TaxID=2109337 RepID=A0ABW4LDP6_9MICO